MSRRLVFAGLAAALGCTESTPNPARPPATASAAPPPVVSASVRTADAGEAVTLPESKPTALDARVVSGDRTFLGAKAKDFESGKKIATLAAAKDRLRPEVVCGEPPATTREIPLD